MEASREAYVFGAAPEPLSWRTALSLGLWASWTGEVDAAPPEASAAESSIRAAASELADSLGQTVDPRARGEAVLAFMHRRFLRSYSEYQTRLDTLVATGRYNCVSSAALYAILASAVGLEVSAAATSDHAFCVVSIGADRVDVETTNPYGFDPGSKKEFHDSFGRTTGYAYVPPRNYRDRTPLTTKELLSLILQNRISGFESSGRYAAAVGLAADRWALLGAGGGSARDDLVTRVLNYGASLGRAGNESEALSWVSVARGVLGDDARLDTLAGSALNNLVVKALRDGDFRGARDAIDRWSAIAPAAESSSLRGLVADAELTGTIQNGDFLSSLDVLDAVDALDAAAGGASPGLSPKRLHELGVFVYLREAERLARGGDYPGAAALVQSARDRYGQDSRLDSAERVFRANRVAELHNRFATLYNAGSFDAAAAAARAALLEFPEDRRFLQDLSMAEAVMAGR